MGAACARLLNDRGYDLVLMARSDDVNELARDLGAVAVPGDVAVHEDLRKVVGVAMEKFGRIDGVVNNTGHAAKGDLLALTDDEWRSGLDLLFLNIVRMARLATPVMLRQKKGAFVNISSFAAREPGVQFPVSATLRAAVGNFAKLYTQRYASVGIRMNNVLPGWIDSYPVDDATRKMIPAARAGSPAEVAKAVAFLLSDDASYISGESLLVDGGLVRAV
jgi:NAD(P)-dependent dehydrogenase (short-subunit alcohol dehydrogenase family)